MHIHDDFESSLAEAEHCFFLLKGCLVPYFIDKYESGQIKFESCNNPEDCKSIVSRSIYLHKSQIHAIEEKEAESFQKVIGFQLLNAEDESLLGSIVAVEEFPQQEMAIVESEANEFMIPLNVHNVKAVDLERKIVYIEVPDGLLEL